MTARAFARSGAAFRPRLLDLGCCQGGASAGYVAAGFDVTGVDFKPQPRYPYRFIQANAFEYIKAHGHEYDAIHWSPPCQRYTRTNAKYRSNHPDDIGPAREALKATGKPYVIENVEDARALLLNPLMLCGSMFGLPIERHRYFETSFPVRVTWGERLYCRHIKTPVLVTGVTRRKGEPRRENSAQECRDAMGITWMTREGLDEALPPAYTLFIGAHLLNFSLAYRSGRIEDVGGRNAADQRSRGEDRDLRQYTAAMGAYRTTEGIRGAQGADGSRLLHDRSRRAGTPEEYENGKTPEIQGITLLTKYTDGGILLTSNEKAPVSAGAASIGVFYEQALF